MKRPTMDPGLLPKGDGSKGDFSGAAERRGGGGAQGGSPDADDVGRLRAGVSFDRSAMEPMPTLKERPRSRETRRKRRERKVKHRRKNLMKTVVVPVVCGLSVILVLAVSFLKFNDKYEKGESQEEQARAGSPSQSAQNYEAVRAQTDAQWKEKRGRLLSESGDPDAEARDVEAELEERRLEQRKRELLGKDAPLSDVFREKAYLPDRDD